MLNNTSICRTCGREDLIENFPKNKNYKNGITYDCCDCKNKKQRDWFNSNKEKAKYYSNKKYLKKKFGISPEEYGNLLNSQDNKCGICKCDLTEKIFHLDHDHKSGKIRKFLCINCNVGLGSFKDDINLLLLAAEYLKNEKA